MRSLRKEWGFGEDVLDVGVGAGRVRGSVGVDVRRTANVDVQADGRQLPFGDDSFGAAVCYHVIEHLRPAAADDLVAEVARVCESGGTVHLLVDRDTDADALFAKDSTHVYRYAPDEVREIAGRYLDIGVFQTHNLIGNVHKYPLTWWRYLGQATKVYVRGQPR